MKHFKPITTILAALLISGAAIFYSCSKQESSEPLSVGEQPEISSTDQLVLNRIEGFKTKMMDFKNNPDFKAGGEMTYDSAIWYIDATLNYTYADASYPYAEMHWDTAFFVLDLIDAQRANYDDVFAAYDESLNRLSAAYYRITGEEKQFMMAMVSDAGSLPGLKRNLRIITITGTGTLINGYPWGETEKYIYNEDPLFDCDGAPTNIGAPNLFMAELANHYNSDPMQGCHYWFYGGIDSVVFNYADYPLSNIHPNYLAYKIFAADEAVASFEYYTACLNYNEFNSNIHEMNFYYENLVELIDEWLGSPLNTNNYYFSHSKITGEEMQNDEFLLIFHKPKIYFRNRNIHCNAIQTPPPIE